MIALKVAPDPYLLSRSVRILGRQHNLISNPSRRDPLANPRLRLPILVIVRRVDEVPAALVEAVHDGEGIGFGALAHEVLPGEPKVRSPEAERGDADAGCGRKQTVVA